MSAVDAEGKIRTFVSQQENADTGETLFERIHSAHLRFERQKEKKEKTLASF